MVEYDLGSVIGPKGDTGATGPQGPKGDAFTFEDFTPEQLASLKGPKGDTGAQGPQGEKGNTGLQCQKGDKGDKGEKGDSATATPLTNTVSSSDTSHAVTGKAVSDYVSSIIGDAINYINR